MLILASRCPACGTKLEISWDVELSGTTRCDRCKAQLRWQVEEGAYRSAPVVDLTEVPDVDPGPRCRRIPTATPSDPAVYQLRSVRPKVAYWVPMLMLGMSWGGMLANWPPHAVTALRDGHPSGPLYAAGTILLLGVLVLASRPILVILMGAEEVRVDQTGLSRRRRHLFPFPGGWTRVPWSDLTGVLVVERRSRFAQLMEGDEDRGGPSHEDVVEIGRADRPAVQIGRGLGHPLGSITWLREQLEREILRRRTPE